MFIGVENLKENLKTWLETNIKTDIKKDESQIGCSRETKYAKFSPKNEHFLPPDTHRVRNIRSLENLAYFVFWEHQFRDSTFCLIVVHTSKLLRTTSNNERHALVDLP